MMVLPIHTFFSNIGKRALYYLYHLKKLIRIKIK